MYKIIIFLILSACSHRQSSLTRPAVMENTAGITVSHEMSESYYENVIFTYSLQLEYQGYYDKAIEGYLFLYERYPSDRFLFGKIKVLKCAKSNDWC